MTFCCCMQFGKKNDLPTDHLSKKIEYNMILKWMKKKHFYKFSFFQLKTKKGNYLNLAAVKQYELK